MAYPRSLHYYLADTILDICVYIYHPKLMPKFIAYKIYPRNGELCKPWDVVILFRMHLLYFTRSEFNSFRQMCTEFSQKV